MKLRWIMILAATLLSPLLPAQQTSINPANQINWPRVTGTTAPAIACAAVNYGEPYTNTTTGQTYVCASTGWVLQTASGGAVLPYPGLVWATSATGGSVALSSQLQGVIGAGVYDAYGAADSAIAGALQKANNLSDLANVTTARTNLGLGSAALQPSTAFDISGAAATAQAAAEAYASDGSNISSGTIGAQYIAALPYLSSTATSLPSTITAAPGLISAAGGVFGSAAFTAASAYDAAGAAAAAQGNSLQIANNLSDLANAVTARTNLGLGTAAIQPSSAFDASGAASAVLATSLQKANNLSDLASAATARTNLGLGTAAVQPSSAFDTAGAAAAAQSAAEAFSANGSNISGGTIGATYIAALPYISTAATSLPSTITSAPGLPFQSLTTTGTGAATLTNGVLNVPTPSGGGNVTSVFGRAGIVVAQSGDYTATMVGADAAGAASAVLGTSLQKANNLSDLANATTARTNLGLGTAATQPSTAFDASGAAAAVLSTSLQKANNLSDLASAATARTNLGLGTIATQGAGAVAITGGTLAGVAITGSTVNGVTPTNTGLSTAYLNAAGQYTTPAGGGNGTVTTVSVATANGVSGTVATPTTTPAITLTLGAITPSSVAASGTITGSTINGVPLGTGGSAAYYLNNSGAYAVPPGPMRYTVNYHASGADICAWIGAAMAALPSTGGSVSTAGEANFASTNQCSAANTRAMFAGSYGNTGKFTHLYLDAQTIQIPVQLVVPYGSEISGSNVGYPSYSGSVIQAQSSYVASSPYSAVSCATSTTQLCTVTTSAPTGVVVGSQVLILPIGSSGVAPFPQIVTAVTSATQFVFPEWVNCNTTPNTVNCAGGSNYPAATYAALTTGTVIVPMVALGDIQFSELTRLDHLTLDMGNVTSGESSIAYFSQTMNENSGSNDLVINNTTYAGFDIEAGGNAATLGAGNFQFEQISIGPKAGVCGRVVEAYANDMRGIHDATCNGFAAAAPLTQGIVFDGGDGANGPFHFENVVDGVVLTGSFPQNSAGSAGVGLGSAFSIYDVNCFTGVTNCVHTVTGVNTPTNFTLRDIKANGGTNSYLSASGAAITNSYIPLYIDGAVNLSSGSLTWGGGAAIPSSSSVCQTSGAGCQTALTPTSVAATGAVSGATVAANGAANGAATLTYTGTAPTVPTTNQWQLAANTAITTPWIWSPAAAPATGVVYGTLTGSTVQQSFTTAPPLTHIVGTAAAVPTIGSGSGAGTSPTVGLSSTATDVSGYISVTTGTAPVAGGVVAQVIFHVAYSSQPKCFTWPANGAAAALTGATVPYIQDGSVQDNTFQLQGGSTALTAATLYEWGYTCTQ